MGHLDAMTFQARDARESDYPSFARLFLELKVPDPTPTQEAYAARVRPHAFFLWEEAGAPVGYAFWQPIGKVARVLHVVVDSAAKGRGVGAALMREVATRARSRGCARWTLNVKPDNAAAIRLYERCGMRETGRWRSMEIAWRNVARLPLTEMRVDGDGEAFLVAPEDDAKVESAAGLLAGQIGSLRAGGDRVLLALKSEVSGTIAGFAAFDPSFPGAMPFVAPRPWIARRLLEAMRPHARPGDTAVRISASNDDVWRAVEQAGGKTMLEIMSMEGAIVLP
jgi:ribosomal protein S18 acetylase RimI-like enzyme